MKRVRFIMVGGFLGAGKTTTLARLARHYQSLDKRVGLVTNDQAQNLVDTMSLRSQGFAVEEVPGACFCCRFDELVGKVRQLQEHERPDIILAEPVGSCTDLVATVIQPLKDLHGNRFEVAPYAVLFKPSHGLRILRNENGAGFSPKAAYIFRKQLEEADAIVLNRIDEMPPAELSELGELISRRHPDTPLLRVSAKTGQGFDALIQLLDQQGDFGRRILDIDYEIYAEGEAELGWLNCSLHVSAAQVFPMDEVLLDIVTQLGHALASQRLETAHLKVIGLAELAFGVANLVSGGQDPELSLPSQQQVTEADVVINARVAADPEVIEQQVRQVVDAICRKVGGTALFHTMQSFRPGRPTPTHRYALAK